MVPYYSTGFRKVLEVSYNITCLAPGPGVGREVQSTRKFALSQTSTESIDTNFLRSPMTSQRHLECPSLKETDSNQLLQKGNMPKLGTRYSTVIRIETSRLNMVLSAWHCAGQKQGYKAYLTAQVFLRKVLFGLKARDITIDELCTSSRIIITVEQDNARH